MNQEFDRINVLSLESCVFVMILLFVVAGLAWATDDMSLREAFSGYGEVHEGMENSKLCMDVYRVSQLIFKLNKTVVVL